MNNPFASVLRNNLTYGTYSLDDALKRIKYFVASGDIDVDTADELTAIAQERGETKEKEIARLEAELEQLKAEE